MRNDILNRPAVGVALLVCLAATLPLSPRAAQISTKPLVTQGQLEAWQRELSNWGRWGADDERGALNLITPAKRRGAAALVKAGITISLARDVDDRQSDDNPSPYQRTITSTGPPYALERIAVAFHGSAHTHIDALAHRIAKGQIYNGFPATEVTREKGAQKDSIFVAREGITTRGVLIDIPALKGVAYLEPGTRIYIEDLEAWERKAGVKVAAGDALFIRTGRWARQAATGASALSDTSGLDASVIPWLRQRDIAVLASEYALDARPSSEVAGLTVHDFALAYLGVPIVDNCDLTSLAREAANRRRWTFQLVIAPLRIPGGTGSPVNPIALF